MREDIITPPQSSSLPFRVRMSGISYCDASYYIFRPSSPLTCIEYVISGKGLVKENETSFSATKGDIYILHEGARHEYSSDAQDPWVKIWMNLSGTAVEHLLRAYGLDRVNHVRGLDLHAQFRTFYETARECKTASEVSERCALLFHGIVQKIAEKIREEHPADGKIARQMKEMIDASNGYGITLDELSSRLFFTKTHLIRVFREEYHITPHEYILSGKLRLAKDLLINTSLPITEISAYLHFCDAHYFTNFFRSRTDCSPREYRARHRA